MTELMGEYWRDFELGVLVRALSVAGDLQKLRLPTDLALDRRSEISASSFLQEFLLPNKLALIGSSLTKQWKSREWLDANSGLPDFQLLSSNFGAATVPVANCDERLYSAHAKESMLCDDFLRYWQDVIGRRDKGGGEEMRCLYLKDWHFCKQFPQYSAYHTAPHFSSDWLNEFWDGLDDGDDYRFVYMGPKNSWSYSWSTNICGRKRWLICLPGEEERLKDRHGHLPFDITSPELQDTSQYPWAAEARPLLEVIQEAGETIFIPSGWHHQVENLEDTISINHNWGNACNVDIMWKKLEADLEELILKAHNGMDYHQMLQFLTVIGCRRCASLTSLLSSSPQSGSSQLQAVNNWDQEVSLAVAESSLSERALAVQEECTAWLENISTGVTVENDGSVLCQVAGLAFELLCLLPVLDALLSSSSFLAISSVEELQSGVILRRTGARLCQVAVESLQLFTKETISLSVDLSALLSHQQSQVQTSCNGRQQ